mmetsp:Transcript_28790/g.61396  ORF Transcript_28790/g.61396 Transcript_28790/m.61396 type:complete len:124 (-) Transcript_28790:50-421(-)
MSQIDGAFPRLNASMLHSGSHNGGIVSLIGKAVSFDGSNTLEFECVDGGKVQVQVNPDFDFQQGKVMEIMGAANEDKTIQVCWFYYLFICHVIEMSLLVCFMLPQANYVSTSGEQIIGCDAIR